MVLAMCMAVTFMLATAVAQANQCPSGGECPSADEPQYLVSLLQTKLRMNVLEDGPSMMKNPEAMLTELEGMVSSGETPAFDLITTIKSLIEDDIMPGLQITRDAAAEATSDALRGIQLCNNESKTEEAKIEASTQVSVDDARSLHAACREAQKILHDHNLTDSDSFCVKLGMFLHSATPLEIPEGHNREHSVKYVKDASLHNMCDRTQVCELDDGCTASEAELADKEAECSANQRSFESEFCSWKVELESNCRNLATCRSQAVAAYDSHIDKTRALVEKWNVETAALHKILCYCNVWLAEKDDCDNRSAHNATQFDVCKDQTYSPNPVNYGTPAAKVACLLTSVANHPGTSGFVTQEYDSFTGFVDSVVPCAEETTVGTFALLKDSTGQSGRCRTADGKLGIHRQVLSDTVSDCKAQCAADGQCVAIEYNRQSKHCEIHETTITHASVKSKCVGLTLEEAALKSNCLKECWKKQATTTTAAAPATTTVTTTGIIQVRFYHRATDCTGRYLPTCGIKGTDLSECTDTVDNQRYECDGKIQIKCQTDGKAVMLYFPSSGCSESLWSDPWRWEYHIDMDTSNYAKARQGQCFQSNGGSYEFLGDTQQFIFPTCKASTTEVPSE